MFCCKCEKNRRKTNFYLHRKNGVYRYTSWCKPCIREYVRIRTNKLEACKRNTIYHYKNRNVLLAKMIERAKNTKANVLGYYSNGRYSCKCCGFDFYDLLVIDHINGGGNKQRNRLGLQSGNSFYRWLWKSRCPEGYQVLCWQCNSCKFLHGICDIPHSEKH